MNTPLLEAVGLRKTYSRLEGPVFDNLQLKVQPGEMVAIMGSSGSGKSSLLHLLGGLDRPCAGEVRIDGHNLYAMSERQRSRLRNQQLGFVYQFHHLLPDFTALENVAMPLRIQRIAREEALTRAAETLALVGLAAREGHRPGELSGGERQRVAIARAMVTRPRCLLADEPTGNLDKVNGATVLQAMHRLQEQFGTAWILVTHDPAIAQQAQRSLVLQDGQLYSQ